MKASYDREAKSIYVYADEDMIASSKEIVPDLVFADYGDDGKLLGLEIVGIEEFVDIKKGK